jgi:hypothetical protein
MPFNPPSCSPFALRLTGLTVLACLACAVEPLQTDPSSLDGSTQSSGDTDTTNGPPADSAGDPTGSHESTTSDDAPDTSGEETDDAGDDSTGGDLPDLDPPAGQSSEGSGGVASDGAMRTTPDGIHYYVIADGSPGPHPLLIVYPGLEGGATMTNNFKMAVPYYGLEHWTIAVLEGWLYAQDGAAGASVLDHVRAQYDIDNDQTYLLSESAGTPGGLQLGLTLRQEYFAAFWANDVSLPGTPPTPKFTADELGFAPFGNSGPGGAFDLADAIVDGMMDAGYRTPAPAPYDGPGAGSHGSNDQFQYATQWFFDKTRL